MKVPFLDLKAQYESIKDELDAAVREVVESQRFIMGPNVQACEEAIAKYANCAHGVGVSSGTDALLIALMAEDIGAGDEVITTPYTFFATAGAIARTGATPVFVDIEPVTYNIDPNQIERRISDRTKAIIPVHLYGQMADMDPIMEIARSKKLVVIEDAAQAIGAEYEGRRAGSIGHYGCFSFFPSKNLGCFGDGGMVVTNDAFRAEKLSILRAHGAKPKYHHETIGGNFRLDALQAAVVLTKLRHLDAWTAARQANAKRYDQLFQRAGLIESGAVQTPNIVASRHVFNQYVIRVPDRNKLQVSLKEQGIATKVYYPIPLHLQECFSYLERHSDFPESERAARETLALPVYPELTESHAEGVVTTTRDFLNVAQVRSSDEACRTRSASSADVQF